MATKIQRKKRKDIARQVRNLNARIINLEPKTKTPPKKISLRGKTTREIKKELSKTQRQEKKIKVSFKKAKKAFTKEKARFQTERKTILKKRKLKGGKKIGGKFVPTIRTLNILEKTSNLEELEKQTENLKELRRPKSFREDVEETYQQFIKQAEEIGAENLEFELKKARNRSITYKLSFMQKLPAIDEIPPSERETF